MSKLFIFTQLYIFQGNLIHKFFLNILRLLNNFIVYLVNICFNHTMIIKFH